MFARVQGADASFGEPGSASRGGATARGSIARMDCVACVGEEESKIYDARNDDLASTGHDLTGARGFSEGVTSGDALEGGLVARRLFQLALRLTMTASSTADVTW